MAEKNVTTDTLHLERLIRGDRNAFSEIFKKYWFELYTYASKKIKSKEDAEEIVQNLFLDLWERRETNSIQNLPAFLKVCIRNKCIDYIRVKVLEEKYSHYCHCHKEIWTEETSETVDYNELCHHYLSGIEQLSAKSKEVFKLSRLDGLTIQEIATRFQLSEKAVEYHLTKALKSMRLHLRDFITCIGLLIIS